MARVYWNSYSGTAIEVAATRSTMMAAKEWRTINTWLIRKNALTLLVALAEYDVFRWVALLT